MNLQYIVTQTKRRVKYIEKPPEVKRFRPDSQPCPLTYKLNGVPQECDCRRCKAYSKALADIRAANPRAYRVVTPKL